MRYLEAGLNGACLTACLYAFYIAIDGHHVYYAGLFGAIALWNARMIYWLFKEAKARIV